MSKKKANRKKPLEGKLGEITRLLGVKWTKRDYSKQKLAICAFCGADILYTDLYFQGSNVHQYTLRASFNANACEKCAVAAGLTW